MTLQDLITFSRAFAGLGDAIGSQVERQVERDDASVMTGGAQLYWDDRCARLLRELAAEDEELAEGVEAFNRARRGPDEDIDAYRYS